MVPDYETVVGLEEAARAATEPEAKRGVSFAAAPITSVSSIDLEPDTREPEASKQAPIAVSVAAPVSGMD